ncbi:MAG: type II toxin-antitoxin system RelE/ParE family toxin [Deltaproteobacteria bacterium]|nr:type II toxin-antitoxin system RelE/ParE family toxin [Deltaproteobacteria bacterium]
MSYEASFKPSFFKDLKKIPDSIKSRLKLAVDLIIKDPHLVGAVKLAGHTHLFRYRLGDYRLVYYLQENRKKILFLIIAHRKDVYKILERSLN